MAVLRGMLDYVNLLVIEDLSIKLDVKMAYYVFQTDLLLWIYFVERASRKKGIIVNITDATI